LIQNGLQFDITRHTEMSPGKLLL